MTHLDNGFSVYERVFTRHEMACAIETLAACEMKRTKAGARHVLSVPAVRSLADDARLLNLAAHFVAPQPVAFRAMLFDITALLELAGCLASGYGAAAATPD